MIDMKKERSLFEKSRNQVKKSLKLTNPKFCLKKQSNLKSWTLQSNSPEKMTQLTMKEDTIMGTGEMKGKVNFKILAIIKKDTLRMANFEETDLKSLLLRIHDMKM